MVSNDKTIIEAFLERCERNPDKFFLHQPMPNKEVLTWTYGETLEEIRIMAAYLQSLNFPPCSRIAICSKNCAHWFFADIAIMLSGHVSVPIYPVLNSETVAHILQHSDVKLLFVGKLDVGPWEEMKKGVPEDLQKISFPLKPSGDWGEEWQSIINNFKPVEKAVVERTQEELATIIYTSGSTGMPKGVMVSFGAMYAAAKEVMNTFGSKEDDRYLSYLPLAHVMERMAGVCIPMVFPMEIWYAESLETFVTDLNRCRPTVFASVPRLWAKFQLGVLSKMPEKKLNFLLKIPFLSSIVKRKILKGLGLDAVRVAASGSAPISEELLEWYAQLGLSLDEAYGMTENFCLSHISRPGRGRTGYVGEPYPSVEQRLTDVGEIEIKSPGMMMGYYKNKEATEEVVTSDGWLKTGDRGEIDELGRLKITGRTKEIFKTSKGKYVAPVPIENVVNNHGHIEMSCIAGSGQPQPFAIVQLSMHAKQQAAESEKFREQVSNDLATFLRETINKKVEHHEALQCLVVVKEDWCPENGLLTPTQKLKRGAIEKQYEDEIDGWYDQKQVVVWAGW